MSVTVDINQLIAFVDPEYRLRRQKPLEYEFSNGRKFYGVADPYANYESLAFTASDTTVTADSTIHTADMTVYG